MRHLFFRGQESGIRLKIVVTNLFVQENLISNNEYSISNDEVIDISDSESMSQNYRVY